MRLEDLRSRWVLGALAGLMLAGTLLRVLMMRAHAPGFIGVNDSAYYMIAAHTNVFVWAAEQVGGNPWPAGYPAFLALIYLVDPNISAITVVQHLLGLLTALLWFLTVRRVVPAAWALLPAAVILLAGPQLFLEHTPLAEPLFSFLIAAGAYSTVRALDADSMLWATLAGGLAAGAGCVRVVGLCMLPLIVLWLLLGGRRGLGRRAVTAGAALAGAGLLLGGYLLQMERATGYGGPTLTRAGSWGTPGIASQPDATYVRRVGGDLTRYWHSENGGPLGGYSYDGLLEIQTGPTPIPATFSYTDLTGEPVAHIPASWYSKTFTLTVEQGLATFMFGYERLTRVEGAPFVLLALAAMGGLVLARGRELLMGSFIVALAAMLLIVPVAYLFYDARYAIPTYGPLAAAGAIGAAALQRRITTRRQKERSAGGVGGATIPRGQPT